MTDPITTRLAEVRNRIATAAARCGRNPGEITLMAVSKTHPAAMVAAGIAAGIRDVGENRVQEAEAKRPEVEGKATWHLIGPLQRNKAGPALEIFDVVHTVDRQELADRLQLLLDRDWPGRVLPALIEINVAEEPQKAGVVPDEAEKLLRHAIAQDRLDVRGLMAIPPFEENPEASRPFFRTLRTVRDRLQDAVGHPLPELSMGMSHDFDVAIEEGATIVRVGTAIFGPRQ